MPNALLGQLQDAHAAGAAIEALKASRNAARTKASEYLTGIGDRAMTEQEQTTFDGYIAEANQHQTRLNAHAALGNIPTDAPQTANNGDNNNSPAAADPNAPVHRAQFTGAPITHVYDNHMEEPWGYRYLGEACEPVANEQDIPCTCRRLTGRKWEKSGCKRHARIFTCYGDYLQTAMSGVKLRDVGQQPDIRLSRFPESVLQRAGINPDLWRRAQIAPAGSSEMVPSDGGFLVYPDFVDALLELVHQSGIIYPMVRHIPLSTYTNSIKIPAVDEQSRKDGFRNGGIQAFWENEAQQLTGSKPTFNLVELITKKLTGLYYATNEVLSDARVLGDFVMRGFGEEFGFKIDDGIIEGTGAGQLTGILSNVNANVLITIAKSAQQPGATVTYPNVLNMWTQMYARLRRTSAWFINQTVEAQLNQMSQQVGTGGVPVFLPNGTALFSAAVAPLQASTDEIAGMSGTLFGRPVYVIEQASVLGTVGDIILFDPTQYLMIDKGPIQAASSMHVRFLTDEMTYRWILRLDGNLWWKTSLSAFKGTTTYGPVVVLATRS